MDNDMNKNERAQANKPRIRYDENGNPIPRKKRPIRRDANGNPIPRENQPVRRDTGEDPIRTKPEGVVQEEKMKKRNCTGIIFAALQALVSIVFFGILLFVDMLPDKYLVVIGIILVVLLGFTVLSQFSKAGKKVGWVFAGLLIVIFSITSLYIWKAHNVIDKVTQTQEIKTKLSDVSIIVMNDSIYEGLEDLKGKEIGVQKVLDRENTELTLSELESKLDTQLDTVEFESWISQVQALYDGDVDAIVINELYRSLINDNFEDFDDDTRVLEGFTYVKEVEQNSSKADIQVDTEPFNVYLSGNDSYGEVTLEDGRSDVNIIATVNPKTKQILLTTTPRDFYVELPFYGGGYYDKLTHTGLYGIDTSIETLENLYQIEIDYYIRLNFSGFRDIVNALDGVEVYSEYEFTSVKGIYFSQGLNYLNGKEALAFVRERKAFADGDFQRGKNQMAMIEALADKIFSPSILTNYMDLMNSVSDCFVTDIPRQKINDLVKMQLNDGAEWTIISNSVMGYGNMRTTYSDGNAMLSCVDPDVGDVALATELILKCMNGEKVVIPDKEAEGIYQGSRLGSIGQNVDVQESSADSEQSDTASTITEDSTAVSLPDAEQSNIINDSGVSSDGSSYSESGVTAPETNTSSSITEESIVTENENADSTGAIEETPTDTAGSDPGTENTESNAQ